MGSEKANPIPAPGPSQASSVKDFDAILKAFYCEHRIEPVNLFIGGDELDALRYAILQPAPIWPWYWHIWFWLVETKDRIMDALTVLRHGREAVQDHDY